MRLWSLHPRYLDAAGLVACWREGLLARAVLAGKTSGYRCHPQLARFQACADPLLAVDTYLSGVLEEARRRGYAFDGSKIGNVSPQLTLPLTDGQLAYELEHLRRKLQVRAPQVCALLKGVEHAEPHPMFVVREGEIEKWEKV